MSSTLNFYRIGAIGFIDWLDPLSWLIKVELVVEATQIRAELLDNGFSGVAETLQRRALGGPCLLSVDYVCSRQPSR